ncbi:CHAT domain-containing protein [Longimicrobium sp.]|uniref:CHAT domain-containing protein n=1 Tax=Longimicrobium sp. TaxID=2029185 RepID=UPI002E339489|nr:CHAT domain-containing protein [Longimicrobium sp.]HEX6042471.1 CHAT domain-containing protein [Longimicrobium sp.]
MKHQSLTIIAGMVLALGAGMALPRAGRSADVMETLRRAQRERVFVARLSMEMDYHTCTRDPAFADSLVPRETCAEPTDPDISLDELEAAGESLDPDSLRASAIAAAFWPRHGQKSLDAAIERLSRARELAPTDVSILVDLSALHLVREEHAQNGKDIAQALDYALAALQLEPGNQPALFNAALATQMSFLREGAEKAWDAYLAVDSASDWAKEAKRWRDALIAADSIRPWPPNASSSVAEVNAFARHHAQRARELGWETVLGDWGKAVLDGEVARADAMLAFAERLGTALTSQDGDPSLSDAVRAIHAERANPFAARGLARAHHAYAAGRVLFEVAEWQMALDSFALVLRMHPGSRPLLEWARAEHAAAMSLTKRVDEAKRTLRFLIATTDSARNPALLARMHWALGRTLPTPDSTATRLEHFSAAAAMYARLHEWESYGATRGMESWAAYDSGDTVQAYRMMFEILRAVRPYRESTRLHNALVETAFLVSKDGMPLAAQRIQDEDYSVAMRVRNPTVPPEALIARARIRMLAGLAEQAAQDLDAAEPLVGDLKEGQRAKDLREQMWYSRMILTPPENTALAAAALDSAKAYFARTNSAWPLLMLEHRVALRLKAGDLEGAEADLDSLTARVRRIPETPGEFHQRAAVIERVRDRYDELVMSYVRVRQPLCALLALDRGRLSFGEASDREACRSGWIAPAPGKVVLEYALIDSTLLTWVATRDSITLKEQRLNGQDLLRTIARVDQALERGTRVDVANTDLRHLYDVLIRPVQDHIPTGEPELVIVADGEIAGVPFAALIDTPADLSPHFLVEGYPVRFAATLADAAPVTDLLRTDGPTLLVANPDFDQQSNRGLDRLTGAVGEVDSLGMVYGDTLLLMDSNATVEAFRKLAPRARVIHYAGHAMFDNSRPERSFLLMAGASASGRLTADSLGGMNLDGVQLVVLSACQTLRGRQGRSGGFAGLSGALLNAGVDGVVGSLWLVNDRNVQPLMLTFHRQYDSVPDAARALRRAQRDRIRAGSPPSAWAGFRFMGR